MTRRVAVIGAAASQDGPELVTLNVQNVPLGAVLESLSVRNKVNIVSGVDTQVPVSANFYDATLDQAAMLSAAQIDAIARFISSRT